VRRFHQRPYQGGYADSVEIKEVFKVAADRGVQIRRMNHRRDSLEDIFLNAMEQNGSA